ncbi:MAG: hypothetical protein IKA02_02125 [Clostridia bacterium]|nr:hypothetical protein [Clostridia bacterium]
MSKQALLLYKFLYMLDSKVNVNVLFINYPYSELRYIGLARKFHEWRLYNSFYDCHVIKIGIDTEGTLHINAESKDFF